MASLLLRQAMNDNQPITAEEHERFERFTSHQARFQERRILAGFCRWMAQRFASDGEKNENGEHSNLCSLDHPRSLDQVFRRERKGLPPVWLCDLFVQRMVPELVQRVGEAADRAERPAARTKP